MIRRAGRNKYTYEYHSSDAHNIISYGCGSPPSLTAFPRGFFAEACPCLASNGRRRGSTLSAPYRLREALTPRSTTRSPKNPALSVLARLLLTGPIPRDFSGTCSLTSHPWGGVPSRSRHCGRCAGGCVLDLRENWNAPKNTCHPGFVENCHLPKFLLRGERSEIRDQRAT